MSLSTSRELEPDHSCLCRLAAVHTVSAAGSLPPQRKALGRGLEGRLSQGHRPECPQRVCWPGHSHYPSIASSHLSATLLHSQLRTWSKTGNLCSSLQSGRWAEETSLTATWKTVSVWV